MVKYISLKLRFYIFRCVGKPLKVRCFCLDNWLQIYMSLYWSITPIITIIFKLFIFFFVSFFLFALFYFLWEFLLYSLDKRIVSYILLVDDSVTVAGACKVVTSFFSQTFKPSWFVTSLLPKGHEFTYITDFMKVLSSAICALHFVHVRWSVHSSQLSKVHSICNWEKKLFISCISIIRLFVIYY